MKLSEIRKAFFVKNKCYQKGEKFTPKGVVVHSTAAGNPWLFRYVDDKEYLGKYNPNNWNQPTPDGQLKACHFFIGYNKDKKYDVIQTLPLDIVGWHAGGKINWTHLGFEVCEDYGRYTDKDGKFIESEKDYGQRDWTYTAKTWDKSVELVTALCLEFGWDPLADGVILSHCEAAKRGLASNHNDIDQWWKRHWRNFSMDIFRRKVAECVKQEKEKQKKASEITGNPSISNDKLEKGLTYIEQIERAIQALKSIFKRGGDQ